MLSITTPRNKMATVFLSSLTALTLILGNSATVSASEPGQQGIPVRVGTPAVETVQEWDEFTGRFRASERVELRARVNGYLEEVRFTDGQMVEKGDVLFVIDQRPFQYAVDSAEARFDLADKELKRAKSLRRTKAISEEDYDERLQEQRIAKSELDEAKLNLEFTEVKAPISGRAGRNLVDVGNLVNGEAALLTTIVTTAPIEFYFEGSEEEFLRYARSARTNKGAPQRGEGYPVTLKLQDEDDFVHEGTLNFIDNELDENTATIQVRAVFPNEDGILLPGLFGRLKVAMAGPFESVVLPPEIIGTEQTRKYVYVLDAENKAKRAYVKLGGLTESGQQIIKEGLTAEDRVILGGLHMVRPGAVIAPIDMNAMQQMQSGEGQ